MEVKIFSHKSDPDGIGAVILAKLVFQDALSITLVKDPQELDKELSTFLEKEEWKNYQKIFVTDLCPSVSILEIIEANEELKEKIHIFDHHLFAMQQVEKNYSFLTEMESKENKKCCGTSLFYSYLLSENLIVDKENIQKFVEMTRLHDTYEWQEKNDLDAFHLQILYQYLGPWGYFYHFTNKLARNETFSYNEEEVSWIQEQNQQNEDRIKDLYQNLLLIEKDNILYAIALGNYEYRNLLSDYIREKKENIDVLLLLAGDTKSFSFRSINPSIDVREIAVHCGGGGHPEAAGGELNQENLKRILKFFKE